MSASQAKRPPGRPRKLPFAAREELLLDAATQAFAERGSGAVSVETIATSAGINKALVYEHFDNKDELLTAVVVRERDRLVEFIAERHDRSMGQPLRDRVHARFHAFIDFAVEHPTGLRILSLPEAPAALAAAGRGPAGEALSQYLEEELRRAGLPAGELAKILTAMFIGMTTEVMQRSAESPWNLEAVVDLLTDFTIAGLQGIDRAVLERADQPR